MKKQTLMLTSWVLATVLNLGTSMAQKNGSNVSEKTSLNIIVKNESWKTFSFDSLLSLIRDNKIKNIDALIPLLPAEMRQNPLLVYNSHALMPYLATLATPRMIFFNQDASLVFSISRNPGPEQIAKGADMLEVIRFNSVNGKFEIYADSFNGRTEPFQEAKLERMKNPTACLSCHGSNPSPLFHDYNGWPGLYGSFAQTGVSAVGSLEHAGLQAFLKNAKDLSRYRDLDLSGFYPYPQADLKNKEGQVIAVKGSAGIAYKVQSYDGPREVFVNKLAFTPHLTFGMAIESLMHRRLAAKLAETEDFERKIFPILFYLGRESGKEFDPKSDIAGHPNDRTKAVYEKLVSLNQRNNGALNLFVEYIREQTLTDNKARASDVKKFNIMSKIADSRGISSIPWTIYFPTVEPKNQSPDADSAKKMLALMEAFGQKLGLTTADVSTMKDTPTTGVFHLARLGGMAVDEQYFQNLMAGVKAELPELVARYEQKAWLEIEADALEAVSKLFGNRPIVVKNKGLLYKR